MSGENTDDVDRMILYALQKDTRNMLSGNTVKRAGTSDSTVHERIQRLGSEGVTKGYSANVDHQESGYPL